MGGQGRQVVGVVIHVVPVARLRRAAVAAAVVSDDTKPVLEEEEHLRVPIVGGGKRSLPEGVRAKLSLAGEWRFEKSGVVHLRYLTERA